MKITCRECGKSFTPWRKKIYCSEPCRRRAENRRLRGDESGKGTEIPDGLNSEKIVWQNQLVTSAVRGDEGPTSEVRQGEWVAVNEITDRFQHRGIAFGWTMLIEGLGWFGRVRDERGQWSFGPSTRQRARQAVERWLGRELVDKREGEAMWRGDCAHLVASYSRQRDFQPQNLAG